MTITLCSHNSLVIVPFVASFGRRGRLIVLFTQYCRVYSALKSEQPFDGLHRQEEPVRVSGAAEQSRTSNRMCALPNLASTTTAQDATCCEPSHARSRACIRRNSPRPWPCADWLTAIRPRSVTGRGNRGSFLVSSSGRSAAWIECAEKL